MRERKKHDGGKRGENHVEGAEGDRGRHRQGSGLWLLGQGTVGWPRTPAQGELPLVSIMFQYFPGRSSPSYGLLISWMRFYLPPTIRQSWVMHLGDSVENIAAHFRLRRKEDALSSLLKAPYILLGSLIFLFNFCHFVGPHRFHLPATFSFDKVFFRLVFV